MFKLKKLAAMVLALAMVSAMSTSVFAAAPSNEEANNKTSIIYASPRSASATITENYVRLRSGPGLNYTAIRQLQKGDMVMIPTADWVDADGYTWVPVTLMGTTICGWVASIYISDF